MTIQTLKIGRQEFVLLAKRDFRKLAAQAQRQTEDDYWTEAALAAEAEARAKNEKPIPFEEVERELDARKGRAAASRQRGGPSVSGHSAWKVDILPSARTDLLKLRKSIQNRIRAAIRLLKDDPFATSIKFPSGSRQ